MEPTTDEDTHISANEDPEETLMVDNSAEEEMTEENENENRDHGTPLIEEDENQEGEEADDEENQQYGEEEDNQEVHEEEDPENDEENLHHHVQEHEVNENDESKVEMDEHSDAGDEYDNRDIRRNNEDDDNEGEDSFYDQSENVDEDSTLDLKWIFGMNKDILGGMHNLCDDYRKEVFYVAGNVGIIFRYESKEQILLQGHVSFCKEYELIENECKIIIQLKIDKHDNMLCSQ